MWIIRISTAALDRIKTFKSNIKPLCFETQVQCWKMRVGARFPSDQVMPQVSSSAQSWALFGSVWYGESSGLPQGWLSSGSKIQGKNTSCINTAKRER